MSYCGTKGSSKVTLECKEGKYYHKSKIRYKRPAVVGGKDSGGWREAMRSGVWNGPRQLKQMPEVEWWTVFLLGRTHKEGSITVPVYKAVKSERNREVLTWL